MALDGDVGEMVELVDEKNCLTGEKVLRSIAHAEAREDAVLHAMYYY